MSIAAHWARVAPAAGVSLESSSPSMTPLPTDQAMAASSAKEVDLLVTWLFRLTQEQYNYKMAAVIGIMVFIICAVYTVVCFRFINKKEATFS